MHPFDVAQGFLDICERDPAPAALNGAFGEAIRALGFRHFACCSHGDPLRPGAGAVVALDYPKDWVALYSERRLDRIDPVFRHAGHSTRPFFWDDPAFRASLDGTESELMDEAASVGIADGYTIPIHAPAALPASCTLLPDSRRIDRASFHAAHLMAAYLHEALTHAAPRPILALSRRERECLELAAQGKSDWVIGQLLGISERTAHNHLEHAKRRLGVASRTQAVVLALFAHLISFGEVLRAGRSRAGRKPESNPED